MKAALYVLALLLIGAGVGAGVASLVSPGQVIHGIDAGLAGTLLAGGFMVLGLATLANSIDALTETLAKTLKLIETRATLAEEAAAPAVSDRFASRYNRIAASVSPEPAAQARFDIPVAPPEPAPEPERAAEVAAVEDRPAVAEVAEPPAPKVDEKAAVGDKTSEGERASQAVEGPVFEEELYVVEEREFRGRPARVLSDGTVEAETDEGWMRFENMEHLEEYLDAMASMAAGRAV